MNPLWKIAVFVFIGFLSTSVLQRNVAGEEDQGMCPFSGEATEDEPASAKYQKPPDHSDSWASKEERLKKLHPDMEIHEGKTIDHPVLGKMKLVTIPVPNQHTGEDFTTGYILLDEKENTEEREELGWDSGTGDNDGGKRNSFAKEPMEKEMLHMRESTAGRMPS